MRNLTISALALLSFATSFAQSGNTWGTLLVYGDADPPTWPQALEGIHMCHVYNPSDPEFGRIVMWGHGVANDAGGKDTHAYVWDTEIKTFIDQSGSPYIGPVAGMILSDINLFCAGHTGDKDGNLFVAGGEVENHSGHGIKSTARFLASSLSWSVGPEMEHARWYPSVVPLADGTLLAVAGTNESGVMSDTPEKFTFGNPSSWSEFNAVVENPPGSGNWEEFDSDFYPFMFTVHNSNNPLVFWAGKRRHEATTQAGLRSHMLDMTTAEYTEFPVNPPSNETPKEGSGAVIYIDSTATAKKGTVIKRAAMAC